MQRFLISTVRRCRNSPRRFATGKCLLSSETAVESKKGLGKLRVQERFCLKNSLTRSGGRVSVGAEEMLDEEDVGISYYMNSTIPGFRGTLKQRFSDFVVNELDCSGHVIRLKNVNCPSDNAASQALPESDVPPEKSTPETVVISNADHIEAFKALVENEDAQLLEAMLTKIDKKEVTDLAPVLLTPDSNKAHRAAIHNFFKSRFPFLVTDTVDGPGHLNSKCVRVRYCAGRNGSLGRGQGNKRGGDWKDARSKRLKKDLSGQSPFDSRGKDDWSSSRPKFLKFRLYKENKNTQDALMVIGRMLGIQPKSFGFAGTKDKRAITTQQVTVFKQPATKLAALNQRLFGIKVGDFSYVEKAIGLGELSGNLFTITLRNVVAESDEAIVKAAEGLKNRGFVNYYGLQRFGSGSVPTHSVGAALLRGEWKLAVDLVLQPRDEELPEIAQAREYFQKTQDVDGALRKFPRQMGSERALLSGLKKHPGNWLMAFNCIPRTMRLMFVHSYQSYLWNHAVSYRLKTYGVEKVVEGDIVYCEELEEKIPHDHVEDYVKDGKIDEITDHEIPDDVEFCDENVEIGSEAISKVKYVTAKDIALGKYTIGDVLLPLPGSSVIYPKNSTADVYQEFADKDSVHLSNCLHRVKDYSILFMTGGYRRIVQKLKDFEWKTIMYDDVTQSLIESDWDAITKNSREEKKADETEKLNAKSSEGALKALQLRFSLSTSSYATMAIRELLKTSTSVAFHKTLNEESDR